MLVSVIIPNFNHHKFLNRRINSVLSQTYKNFEVIILDDSSTDDSWNYLKLFEKHPKVTHCERNKNNSGSPFRQWEKGLQLAKGDLVWIAESDDFSDLSFLEKITPFFEIDDISIVMSSSSYIDENDKIIPSSPIHDIPGTYEGNFFVEHYMYFKNSILNASSVVFRRKFVKTSTLELISDFRLSGDHLFWVELIKDKKLVVLESKLNYFRWHENSVRYKELMNPTELLEGINIKRFVEKRFEISKRSQIKSRRDVYLKYFKFLSHNPSHKNWTEFLKVSSFFFPFERYKGYIRFLFT